VKLPPAAAVLLLAACPGSAQCPPPPPLEELLARVADNQERAVEARRTIVYQQDTWVRLLRTNGKLAREERRAYLVTPTPKGYEKKLERFEGRYERHGQMVAYDKPGFTYKEMDIDGELISDLTEDLVHDRRARDGIPPDLFPLTRNEQRGYIFTMQGCRILAGQPAYHLRFQPRKDPAGDSKPWEGEVFVDPAEFQPRLVTTKLAWRVPAAIRILFGVSIRQLGFQVTFTRVDQGLWFPATYGTEFYLKVLFGYKRNITMNVVNSDFRRTAVDSTVSFPGGIAEP
jgi:hypothetical protein